MKKLQGECTPEHLTKQRIKKKTPQKSLKQPSLQRYRDFDNLFKNLWNRSNLKPFITSMMETILPLNLLDLLLGRLFHCRMYPESATVRGIPSPTFVKLDASYEVRRPGLVHGQAEAVI